MEHLFKDLTLKSCHLTSVHRRDDVRIFYKECISLNQAGFEVELVVADGKGNAQKEGIAIYDAGIKESSKRLSRMIKTVWMIYRQTLGLDADIFHFHDSELIPLGLLLKWRGKKVIYDVHEDLPRQISSKYYLPESIRPLLSKFAEFIENCSAGCFSAISAATPHIRDRFLKFNAHTVDVNNFPRLDNLSFADLPWKERQRKICYIGGISENRGILELVDALSAIDATLDLAGDFYPISLKKKLTGRPGWKKTNELGFLNREEIKGVLASCKVGIVTLYPTDSYMHSLPVKMFEYMAAGIPVVASSFPLWRDIIEKYECGCCVNPHDYQEIAKAVKRLLDDDELAQKMGENGRRAVEKYFNWENESKKMLELYKAML